MDWDPRDSWDFIDNEDDFFAEDQMEEGQLGACDFQLSYSSSLDGR